MSQMLMVKWGSDTSAAKRAIVELASTVATNAISMATAIKGNVDTVQSLTGVLSKLPAAAKGAAAAFVVFEVAKASLDAVSAGIERATKEMERLIAIGQKAQSAGVGTGFLQGFLGQADKLGATPDALESMLKQALSASTVHQGTGRDGPSSALLDALDVQRRAKNLSAADVAKVSGADSQEGRIRAVLDLVEKLMAAGKQLAAFDIASTMFGSDFEGKLRTGVDVIGAMREALNGMAATKDGRLPSQEEIERASKIKETLDEASRIMNDAMRPANEDIARWSQQQAQSWADMKVSMAECVGYLMKVYSFASSIGDALSKWGSSDFWVGVRDWMDKKGLIDRSTNIPGIDNGPEQGPQLPAGQKPLELRITGRGDKSKNKPAPAAARSSGAETDPVDTFINSIEKASAALKAEIEAYDKSNAEKRVAIDLAKAEELAKQNGTTLTEQQTERIKAASTAAAQYKDKLADLEQAQRLNAQAARYMGDALSDALGDAIFSGTKLTDVLKNLVSSVGRQALSALMTGSGSLAGFLGTAAPASAGGNAIGGLVGMLGGGSGGSAGGGLGGLISSLFGGFRANGGPVQAGRTYRVNELGEEFFTPDQNGTITPAGRGGGGGMGAGVTIIDQRTMEAPAPEVRSRPGGGSQIILRDAANALAGQGMRGRGPLAPVLNTPGTRRG